MTSAKMNAYTKKNVSNINSKILSGVSVDDADADADADTDADADARRPDISWLLILILSWRMPTE